MNKCFLFLFLLVFFLQPAEAQDGREKAKELNQLAAAAYNKIIHPSNRDSVAIYRAVIEGVNLSVESDRYDRMPTRNGKIKAKFAEENGLRMARLYPMLIDAGLYLVKSEYTRQQAMDALEMYLELRNTPLAVGIADESGTAAYYLAYYHLKARNYYKANKYADTALRYDESAVEAAEIKAQCMNAQMITTEDSLRYLKVLTRLYESDPTNDTYFSWVMKFYQNPSPRFNLESFVDKQLEENYNKPTPWILKGEIAMNAKRWDEAIEAYKAADEIDPSSIPVAFNIGVCLNMKGIDARNLVAEKKQKGEFTSENEYKEIFAEARTYLERVRAKDPRRNKVDWVSPLYMIYTILEDKIKAGELEPLVSKYKD